MNKNVNKKMNNKIILPLIAFLSVLVIVGVFVLAKPPIAAPVSPGDSAQEVEYGSSVCIYKNSELIDCGHNILFNTGADGIEDYLAHGISSAGQPVNITLCNSTSGSGGCGTPIAAATEDYDQAEGCGLDWAAPDGNSDNGDGNWSIWNTFTSTCDAQTINVSRLYYNESSVAFAGKEFPLVPLQTSDQLTVNWTIWITSS